MVLKVSMMHTTKMYSRYVQRSKCIGTRRRLIFYHVFVELEYFIIDILLL